MALGPMDGGRDGDEAGMGWSVTALDHMECDRPRPHGDMRPIRVMTVI
jgi:hypothetical protein